MAELVDALDSKSSAERRAGSIPAGGTSSIFAKHRKQQLIQQDQVVTPRLSELQPQRFPHKAPLYPLMGYARAPSSKRLRRARRPPTIPASKEKAPRGSKPGRANVDRSTQGNYILIAQRRKNPEFRALDALALRSTKYTRKAPLQLGNLVKKKAPRGKRQARLNVDSRPNGPNNTSMWPNYTSAPTHKSICIPTFTITSAHKNTVPSRRTAYIGARYRRPLRRHQRLPARHRERA